MEKILLSLIRQRLLVFISFTLIILAGLYAFKHIPIDAFPDLTNNQVQVLTESPGMAPVEVEQLVTIPIESIMNGIPKVEEVRSISKLGLSVVTVVFKDNVDIYFARQLVNERLQSAKSRLPIEANSELGPITTGMGEIYQYVIEGKGYTPEELKIIHDWDVKYQLRTVAGVNEVNSWGGFTREYVVTVFPDKLIQYDITLNDVIEALQKNNNNFSSGLIEHSSEQYVIRGIGLVNRLEDISNIKVKYHDGIPILISHIGNVKYDGALRQGAVTKDGKGEVIAGIVMMLKGENSREVITLVKDKLKDVAKSLPDGVSLKPFYDQTHLIDQTIHTVQINLLEGGMLVTAVLFFMLGNLRAAIIVAITIPISMMFSFIGMKSLGITANIMSLGAIDFGMIVDGSIVMVENTLRKYSSKENSSVSYITIIQESLKEMYRPILFGILIITVVYIPILSLEGMEYKMFSPMVYTVCFALIGSLFVSLLLVPVLCSVFLKNNQKEKHNILIRLINEPYLKTLNFALENRKKTILITVMIFLAACLSLTVIGTEFVPKLDEGDFIVEVRNLPSISLSEAINSTTKIERIVKTIPEVEAVVSKIGRPDLATDPMGVYQADVLVKLKEKQKWRNGINKNKLADELSETLNKNIVGTNFSLTQPIEMRVNELVSGVRADVAVKIFGDNFDVLVKEAEKVEKILADIKGNADLQTEQLSGMKQVRIIPDRNKLARYGVNISDIRQTVNVAIMGEDVSEILDERKRFTLRLRFPKNFVNTPDEIKNILIETPEKQRIPLGTIADIQVGEGLEIVNREFGQRRIIVQCNVRGRDVGSFVEEGIKKIEKEIKLPPGYYIEWGGQFENQQRAMSKLMIVVPVSILIIFFLLMATFASVKYSLIVILNVPFALIGGILALWLRGMYLSVPACVGFIALFGVAILNGLVLISYFNKLAENESDIKTVIYQGVKARLRPVLTTAFVATLGFLPMAISTDSGAEIQKPLATVVIGGLITSTLLTLIVLPVIYSYLHNDQEKTNTAE